MIEICLDLFKIGGRVEYDVTIYQKVFNNNILVLIYKSNIYDFSKVSKYVS
jgi:hypothetical protein